MKTALAAFGVVLLGLLGWLVWPRSPGGPLTLRAGTAASRVAVTVTRPRLGTTDLTLTLTSPSGAAQPGAFILCQATMPLMGTRRRRSRPLRRAVAGTPSPRCI